MKTLKYILSLCVVILALTTCSDDEKDLNFISNVEAPSDLAMLFQVTQDNTGLVTIIPTAQGAIGFDIYFGDDTLEPENFSNGQNTSHTYAEGTYTVTAVAYGVTGLETTFSQELVVSFQAPANVEYTIENDSAMSKQVNVTVSADFAVSFDVTSEGLIALQDPLVSANIGDTAVLNFEEAGMYTITIEVMGAAEETSIIVVEDFEVTEIISPLTSAPNPPSREAGDVVSLYSDAYNNINLSELNPGWGQTTTLTELQVEGNNTWFYNDLNYTGIVTDYGNATDISAMEFVHFDYWTPDATVLGLKLVNTSYADGDPLKEDIEFADPISLGEWVSVDIPLAEYTTDVSGITQLLFDTIGNNAIIYVDNLYFYKETPNTTSQTIGFETGFELSSFDGGGISIVANPDTNGNNSAMVAEMVKGTGQVWAGSKISVGTPFDITSSSIVTVKVWSPRVGLDLLMKFEDNVPWPNNTGSAEITATTTLANQWETLTFDHSGIDESIDWYNMVLIMDNGTEGDGSSNYTIYLDDITSTPLLDFEPEFSELSSFDGGGISVISNPDTNGNNSAMVAEMVKGTGQVWAGSKISVGTPFDITSSSIVTVKVWSPRVGLDLLMKFEDNVPWPNNTGSAEITATTTLANQWETLTFDHSGIDESIDWYNMVLIMDNGTEGDGSSNYTIYLDDISIN